MARWYTGVVYTNVVYRCGIPGGVRQKQFQVRLSEEDAAWLRARIAARGVAESAYLRGIVERAVVEMRANPDVEAEWETAGLSSDGSQGPASGTSPTGRSSGGSRTRGSSSTTPSDSEGRSTTSSGGARSSSTTTSDKASTTSSSGGVCEVFVQDPKVGARRCLNCGGRHG